MPRDSYRFHLRPKHMFLMFGILLGCMGFILSSVITIKDPVPGWLMLIGAVLFAIGIVVEIVDWIRL